MAQRFSVTDRRGSSHCSPEVTLLSTAEPMAADRSARPQLEAIYDEHGDFLYAALRRLGLDGVQAEDALQDVLVVVHRRLDSFEGRGTLRSWLYGVAVRVAREHRRRRSLQRRVFRFFAPEEQDDIVDARAVDPQRSAEHAQELGRLDALLSELGDQRREILVLVEILELTVPEAAESLGLGLNTAYSRLRLARRDLRAALERQRARRTP